MKMVMIEEDEEQQKENMEQQDETVMQSVEKVDEDGNMIHRMDRRNNYLDKGKVEMTAYPILNPATLDPASSLTYATGGHRA